MNFKAFFVSAQDARRCLNALQAANVEATLEAADPPQDGRQWMLVIEVPTGSSTTRMPNAALADRAVAIVRKFNGVSNVGLA